MKVIAVGVVDAQLAIAIRSLANVHGQSTKGWFRCPECGETVMPIDTEPPTFKHETENGCPGWNPDIPQHSGQHALD